MPAKAGRPKNSIGTKSPSKSGKASAASKSKKRQTRSKPVTAATRAGTMFPPGRLARMLRRSRLAERSSVTAGVYMAAVLEYVCAEVLELAGNHVTLRGKKLIQPKDINLGIRGDDELNKLLWHATIAEGSVVPHIEDQLLPKKKAKKMVDGHPEDATQPL